MMIYALIVLLSFCSLQADYPNYRQNPYLTKEIRKNIKPYLIPLEHPAKAILDALFSSRVLQNEQTLAEAGFITIFSQETSFVKVVKHPCLEGYLLKLYLDNETRLKKETPGWEWLANRCKGAERIRKIIAKKKIKHFEVPDKYIYIPPPFYSEGPICQPIILLVTDMKILNRNDTKWAWKHYANYEVLDELHYILSKGCGSRLLSQNVPFTESGKFAFIDTEYPKRKISLNKATNYFSDEMQAYWNSL